MTDLAKYMNERAGNPELGLSSARLFQKSYGDALGKEFDWSSDCGKFLITIFGNSHALADRLISDPALADEIAADNFTSETKPKEKMTAELGNLLDEIDPSDPEEQQRLLRRYCHRELIRIVARDFSQLASTEEILREWSSCADALIDTAYRKSNEYLSKKYGELCPGCVIALGKLGAYELNYSSDVDLLFLYESDDPGDSLETTPHEYHRNLAARVTRLLSLMTDDGFALRVDHDLRPEGKQGPLTNSIDAAERYYGYFGQDWERQCLIRARPVAGDIELGNEFVERVRPFVYRRTIGMDDLKAMRALKKRMRDQQRRGKSIDVKHDRGGIRSLEYLIQALQLTYGGKTPSLQTPSTFEALRQLENEKLIHPRSAERLAEAYIFLRQVENATQIVREQQIHHLPEQPAELEHLARRLGYRDKGATRVFENDLKQHMTFVSTLVGGMFTADYERIELTSAIDENLAKATNDEEAFESFPWFKHQETRRIQHLDLEEKLDIKEVLGRLTLVAEAVIATARKFATSALMERYGTPRDENGNPASFAVIGMGKLGSKEIDYGSDLDLIFVYSDGGKTDGERSVDNAEFFAKLAQRIISLVSTASRYGRAYEVDSELRPSGHQGLLVSSHSSFLDYHLNKASAWERTALMRARVIDGDEKFMNTLRATLKHLAFETQPPDKAAAREEMDDIRTRVKNELMREDDTHFDLKHGPGGSDDLDAIIQQAQLMNAHAIPRLRTNNTFEILTALYQEGVLADHEYEALEGALYFYRTLLSRVRLFTGRTTKVLDTNSPYAEKIAKIMGLESADKLVEMLKQHRKEVLEIFEKHLASSQ